MKKITQTEFDAMKFSHILYLDGEKNGVRMNLEDCDLQEIDLSGADLSGAYLSRADLSGANLPSPTGMLLAQWGELSDNLTIQAMAFDANCHNDPLAFDVWKKTGICPYQNSKFQRACNFREKRKLWDSSFNVPRIWDLMVAIIREKCANSDFHDKV